MPISTPTSKVGSGATGASHVTASFTPTAGALLIAAVSGRLNGVPGDPTLTGGGLTWTPFGAVLYNSTNPQVKSRVWYTIIGGSPAAMTLTGGVTSAGRTNVACIEIASGYDTDFSNYSTGSNTAGDPSVTLPSGPAANSTVLGFATGGISAANWGTGLSQPSGFTDIQDYLTTDLTSNWVYDAASALTTFAWTSAGTTMVAHGIEIKEAAVATTSFPPIGTSPAMLSMLMR